MFVINDGLRKPFAIQANLVRHNSSFLKPPLQYNQLLRYNKCKVEDVNMVKTTYDNRRGADEPKRKHKIQETELVRKTIMGLAKQGKTIDEIADIVGVSTTYLKTKYGHEIKCGREIANALVTENIYQQALKDSPSAMPAAMFIAKARMGWKEKEDPRESQPAIVFDFGSMTYEERLALKSMLQSRTQPEPITIEGEVLDDE
jgi:hypothetical protein